MIQVRAPDGTIVRFPDGTAPAQINSVMGAYHDASLRATKYPGWMASLSNGVLLGHGGDIDALNAGAETGLHNAFAHLTGQKDAGYSMGQAVDAVKAADARADSAYARQHPAVDLGAQVTGAVLNPLSRLGGKWVGQAGGLWPAMARASVVGATEGGIAGGPKGAVQGAVVGGAIPGGSAVLTKGGRAIMAVAHNVQRSTGFSDPAVVAVRRLAAAAAKDVHAGADPVAALKSWPGASKPTLSDIAGENVRATVRDAGTQGPARQTLARYRDQVAADLQDHALNLTQKLTPAVPQTAPEYAASLRAQQSATADKLYPAFKADLIPVDDTVKAALSGEAGASALRKAHGIADVLRDWTTRDELASLGGAETMPTHISAGSLDLVRRGLRDTAGAAFQAGDNTLAAGLKSRATDLESALMNSPGFDAARKSFANYANQMDAVDHGAGVLNKPPSVFIPPLSGMPAEVNLGARVGARQALADAIGRPTEGAVGVLNRISTATNPAENLGATFGDDVADAYRQGLQAEVGRMQNANWLAPQMGSKTASSHADALSNLMHLPGLALGVAKTIVGGAPLNDAERAAVVDAGISTPAMNQLQQILAKSARPPLLPGYQWAVTPAVTTSGQAMANAP